MKNRTDQAADLSMMAIIHQAFRRDLERLGGLVEGLRADAGSSGRTAAQALWTFVLGQLEHHHTSEDERLWPLVRAKSLDPAQAAVLDRMEQEHSALARVIEDLTDALRSPASGVEQLGDAVRRVKEQLEDHLAHEERDAVPLVEALLTQAELASFESHQKKQMGIRGAALFFPWLLDGLDERRRGVVLQQLPAPLRLLARTSWQRRYDAESRLWRRAH